MTSDKQSNAVEQPSNRSRIADVTTTLVNNMPEYTCMTDSQFMQVFRIASSSVDPAAETIVDVAGGGPEVVAAAACRA